MPETPDQLHESESDLDAETIAIRTLNDHLRQTFSGGRVVMTDGVGYLEDGTIARTLAAVRDFTDFTPDNDPYGTHEFAAFEVDGHSFMFKVDAYDQNMEYGSPNPADPSVTTRALTILLASEY